MTEPYTAPGRAPYATRKRTSARQLQLGALILAVVVCGTLYFFGDGIRASDTTAPTTTGQSTK